MDKLLAYLNSLPTADREAFAGRCGTTVGYLRKAASVGQKISEGLCLRVGIESHGAVKPADLRPDVDWDYLRAGMSNTSPAPGAGGHETPHSEQDAGTDGDALGAYLGERVVLLSAERLPLRLALGDDRYVIVNEADRPATPQSPPPTPPAPACAESAPPALAPALLSAGKE